MIDQVRSIIIEYLAGRITARDLAVGLPDGWELDGGDDAEARDLTLRVVGHLAEYERGDRDERALRMTLMGLIASSPETSLGGGRTEVRELKRYPGKQSPDVIIEGGVGEQHIEPVDARYGDGELHWDNQRSSPRASLEMDSLFKAGQLKAPRCLGPNGDTKATVCLTGLEHDHHRQ
jgi:hypothetical protein